MNEHCLCGEHVREQDWFWHATDQGHDLAVLAEAIRLVHESACMRGGKDCAALHTLDEYLCEVWPGHWQGVLG